MSTTVDLEATIQEAVRRLVAALDPEMIILFGSAARGEFGPDSDLDFLVVVDLAEDYYEASGRAYRAMRGLGVAMDIILTTPERYTWRHNIIGTIEEPAAREGTVVYERG